MSANDDYCRDRVQALDRDRYLTALYAPAEKRRHLFALYAFNAEIADITARAGDALPGEIRLQWWREVLTGGEYGAAGSPVATALLETVTACGLPPSAFETYLDARICDLYADPFETRTDLEAYCGATASAILQISSLILDPGAASKASEACGHGGCAQGIAGLLRRRTLYRRRGKVVVPLDMLAAAGLSAERYLADGANAEIRNADAMMIALARDHFAKFEAAARALPASLRPALLPVALVPAYLGRTERSLGDPHAAPADISELTRQWTLMRRAARGW